MKRLDKIRSPHHHIRWSPQLLTTMALAQPKSYVKHSHIRCPPMLTISAAQILKISELGKSVTSVDSIISHDRKSGFEQRSSSSPHNPIEFTLDRCDWYISYSSCSEKYQMYFSCQSSGHTIFLVSNPCQGKKGGSMLL